MKALCPVPEEERGGRSHSLPPPLLLGYEGATGGDQSSGRRKELSHSLPPLSPSWVWDEWMGRREDHHRRERGGKGREGGGWEPGCARADKPEKPIDYHADRERERGGKKKPFLHGRQKEKLGFFFVNFGQGGTIN